MAGRGRGAALGIPNFKSAKNIVDEKIEALQAGGVEFHFNTRVGEDVTWDELKAWDAVFLGHGAGFGKRLRLDGEELDRVYSATEFLVRANLRAVELPDEMRAPPAAEGQRVVVVGGGGHFDGLRADGGAAGRGSGDAALSAFRERDAGSGWRSVSTRAKRA